MPGKALDVLIVEDEILLAAELQYIVRDAGLHDVGLAASCDEAVALACRFMTANVKRLPDDLAGACGVIGKPYSEHAVCVALQYLRYCLTEGHAPGPPPVGLRLSPEYIALWGADLPMSA
jgi:hypothetical protein